jgi:hypothetical protein
MLTIMTYATDEKSSLNPHFGQVIGFVDSDGTLHEEPTDEQFNLLINVGEEDDVRAGERVLVFGLGPRLVDPHNGRDLGCFEIVRGEGKVKSVQTRMAVITSTAKRDERRAKPLDAVMRLGVSLVTEYETVAVPQPFIRPQCGDLVRFI